MKNFIYNQNFYTVTALGLSAASALMYEVVATHVLFFYFIESSYSISTVLSVFMFGLAAGSFIAYKILPKISYKPILFGLLQVVIGIYTLLIISRLEQIIPRISDWGAFRTSLLILFVPTLLLGAVFPIAASLFRKDQKDVTGLVYAADLAGAIIGSVISGFILIPKIGNGSTVAVGAGLNFLSALIIFSSTKKKKLILLPFGLMIFTGILLLNNNSFLTKKNLFQKTNNAIQYFSNSPYGPVKVENNTLFINQKEMCSKNYPQDTAERKMVDYALQSLNKNNAKMLNIGLGCGLTLEQILKKTTQTVDVVEINPQVVEANKTITDVLDNPRVNLIVEDGLKYLRETNLKYDSVLVDIEDPTVAHSSGLYTVEAFKIIEKTLKENGSLAFWQYDNLRPEYYDIIYYSLKEAFPYVYNYPGVFIGSNYNRGDEQYQPTTPYKINTLDKNTLTDAYLKDIKKK